MNVCVCFQISVLRGLTSPISWLSPDAFSEYIYGLPWDGVQNTGKDDMPSRPLRTPFSSLAVVFTPVHSETCLTVLALMPRFEAGVGIPASYPLQWPESESPQGEPLCEGDFFKGGICTC